MKVTRTLTLPGRREYESSSITVEFTEADLPRGSTSWSLQEKAWWLTQQAQAHVLYTHAADHALHSDEVKERLALFQKGTPNFLKKVEEDIPSKIPSSEKVE